LSLRRRLGHGRHLGWGQRERPVSFGTDDQADVRSLEVEYDDRSLSLQTACPPWSTRLLDRHFDVRHALPGETITHAQSERELLRRPRPGP
jgi:hypothetical protein